MNVVGLFLLECIELGGGYMADSSKSITSEGERERLPSFSSISLMIGTVWTWCSW
jgi:hypothetical protein